MDKYELLERKLARERSARKQAERLLEEKSREIFHVQQQTQFQHNEKEQLLAAIQLILIGLDENYQVTRWNHLAESIFDIPADEAKLKNFRDLAIEWDWELPVKKLDKSKIAEKPTRLMNHVYRRANGEDGFVTLSINPVFDLDRNFQGFLILGDDVTERKRLESQLNHAQKLESIGQLAAGIAHEINTPAQFVGDNIYFLKDAFEDFNELVSLLDKHLSVIDQCGVPEHLKESVRDIMEHIEEINLSFLCEDIPAAIEQAKEGVARISSIVKAMKEFSHPGGKAKECVDLNSALESTLTVARNEWKYVAEIEKDLDPELPLVECLVGELNQTFLNLIVNAAHAIAEKSGCKDTVAGTITVRTLSEGVNAIIEIHDTGKGIPNENLRKIFDPFFTTKGVGKGTGQGLYIAHSVIVEKHSGEMSVESVVGEGTCFRIKLPLKSPQSELGSLRRVS